MGYEKCEKKGVTFLDFYLLPWYWRAWNVTSAYLRNLAGNFCLLSSFGNWTLSSKIVPEHLLKWVTILFVIRLLPYLMFIKICHGAWKFSNIFDCFIYRCYSIPNYLCLLPPCLCIFLVWFSNVVSLYMTALSRRKLLKLLKRLEYLHRKPWEQQMSEWMWSWTSLSGAGGSEVSQGVLEFVLLARGTMTKMQRKSFTLLWPLQKSQLRVWVLHSLRMRMMNSQLNFLDKTVVITMGFFFFFNTAIFHD